jgi:hypothetical protein
MSLSDARRLFDPLLASFGFALATEHSDHESFGSSWAEYRRRGLRFRLVWDGKDGLLLAQVADQDGQLRTSEWQDLEQLVQGRIASADAARRPERVTYLSALTKQFLNGLRRSGYDSG